jgi:hypothetical protein
MAVSSIHKIYIAPEEDADLCIVLGSAYMCSKKVVRKHSSVLKEVIDAADADNKEQVCKIRLFPDEFASAEGLAEAMRMIHAPVWHPYTPPPNVFIAALKFAFKYDIKSALHDAESELAADKDYCNKISMLVLADTCHLKVLKAACIKQFVGADYWNWQGTTWDAEKSKLSQATKNEILDAFIYV